MRLVATAPSVLAAALIAACSGPAVEINDDDGTLGRGGGLLVATRSGPAELIRLDDGRRLSGLELGEPRQLMASQDGAVAFTLTSDGARLIDGGMRWYVHGKHYHVRAGRPRLLPHRPALNDLHGLASAQGRYVLFAGPAQDGLASAVQLYDDDLPNDEVRVERFALGPWHAGAAAPISGAVVATAQSEGGTGLSVFEPGAVERPIGAGCTGAPSSVSFHDSALFACKEGLLRVAKSGSTWGVEATPWPQADAALGISGHPSKPVIVGRSETALFRYDDSSRRLERFALDGRPVRAGVDRSEAPVSVALLDNGRLATIRAEGSVPAYGAVDARSDAAAPLAVGLGRAFVASSDGGAVLEISLADLSVLRRFELPGGVLDLALIGHKWFNVPDETVNH